MQITPLTPTLGTEISGVDLRSLDETGFDRLRSIWLDYKVIFLREQAINLDDYDGHRRCLYRTTIAGTAPLSV
jgi:taurine dioxygenase